MTADETKDPGAVKCGRLGCDNLAPPSMSTRPRKYCDDQGCKKARHNATCKLNRANFRELLARRRQVKT